MTNKSLDVKQPHIAMIVAMANDRVIGVDNTLPWRLSADLKRFKAITMGKPIVMGRKTWDSIGRPLPGRLNIVISRNPDLVLEGATVLSDLQAAIACAQQAAIEQGVDEIMIMGGANIYEQALPLANRLYVTQLALAIEGDAYFPAIDVSQWRIEQTETHHQTALDEHSQPAFDYHYQNWVRVN